MLYTLPKDLVLSKCPYVSLQHLLLQVEAVKFRFKGQAGQRRQEGDQIHEPHPGILNHGWIHGLQFLCAFYLLLFLKPQRKVNALPSSDK